MEVLNKVKVRILVLPCKRLKLLTKILACLIFYVKTCKLFKQINRLPSNFNKTIDDLKTLDGKIPDDH